MQISVQLYSVREALSRDPAGTLTRLRDLGLTRVEPFGLLENAAMLGENLGALGLAAPTAHADVLATEDLGAVLSAAGDLGVTTLIHPHTDPALWQDEAGIRRVAEQLDRAAVAAREAGITTGYHNHAVEAEPRFAGRTGLEVLHEALREDVVLELDTYWAVIGGSDPVQLLATLGERVRAVHLKDGTRDGRKDAQQPLGGGELDVAAIVAASRDAGHLGVLEFDDFAGDIFEGIAASLTYLDGTDTTQDKSRENER